MICKKNTANNEKKKPARHIRMRNSEDSLSNRCEKADFLKCESLSKSMWSAGIFFLRSIGMQILHGHCVCVCAGVLDNRMEIRKSNSFDAAKKTFYILTVFGGAWLGLTLPLSLCQ